MTKEEIKVIEDKAFELGFEYCQYFNDKTLDDKKKLSPAAWREFMKQKDDLYKDKM